MRVLEYNPGNPEEWPLALGYVRVSTAEQASVGHSVRMQIERIQAWCLAKCLRLIDVIVDEGVSASKPLKNRKGGAVLLQRMAAKEAAVAVAVAVDRMFRDAQDGLNTLNGMDRKGGLSMQSVTEPIDTSTAMGRFIMTVWLAKAQLEREQTCERTLAASTGLRKSGRSYGTTPYGCIAHGGRNYRDPMTWPHRELIVALRTPDADGKQLSLEAICEELYARSIPSPDNRERWGKNTVSRIINSHGGLKHIPPLPTDHETAVSEAATP